MSDKPKMFPLQAGYSRDARPGPLSIPWSVAEKAYGVYAARYGRSQSLERLAERGGFGTNEMDDLYPPWRAEVDEIVALRVERDKLQAAITEHAQQKADDRCWLDDIGLYSAAGVSHLADNQVGDKTAMLKNCERYIERRCAGGKWPTYAELEAELARIDAVMARRPALDKPTRAENIEHAIATAKLADDLKAERDKLQAFKDWVHAYLDGQGVPHHPSGTHGAAGCRIGDRMDWLMERLRTAEAEVARESRRL